METTLSIILAVLVVIAVWCIIAIVRRDKRRNTLLQERINEFNEASDMHIAELHGAKHRVDEAIAETANLKKLYDNILKEHEDLKLNCQRAKQERDDVKAKYSALLEKREELLAEIERLNNASPTLNKDDVDVAHRVDPNTPIGPEQSHSPFRSYDTPDFDELRKSYEELAKSYDDVSQRYENPSKTYLVSHIIKAYNVKNNAALAKSLGISAQAINKMLK